MRRERIKKNRPHVVEGTQKAETLRRKEEKEEDGVKKSFKLVGPAPGPFQRIHIE